jgi:hypothetical protein
MESYNMPEPKSARNPLDLSGADDSYLLERFDLISKKYAGGLDVHETTRLAEIEDYLDRLDLEKADLLDARGADRTVRINGTLDRVESAIRNLQALKLN